ncbi:hypothetical protein AB990_02930 [Alkalihalobacillus pseudalcaliphilus]|nr:hypothetical protein AB990_02930 [Alkalihalobacillus pseudalcaliphilus]
MYRSKGDVKDGTKSRYGNDGAKARWNRRDTTIMKREQLEDCISSKRGYLQQHKPEEIFQSFPSATKYERISLHFLTSGFSFIWFLNEKYKKRRVCMKRLIICQLLEGSR